MNFLIQKTLDNRGYTRDYILDVNNPNHDELMDIDKICVKLKRIHDEHKNIVVLPDFDTDGIMSGVIGFAGLAELGFSVSLFMPDTKAGYGFNSVSIDTLLASYPDTDAIITCDVGITCHDGIAYAKSKGIDVLVTDHHLQIDSDENADVIVDPKRSDEKYSHPSICGAYVLYQILEHYASLYCDVLLREQIHRLCVFAGIGTVSDVMPLLYENRQLVRDSIAISKLIYADGDDVIVSYIYGNDIYRRAFYGLHTFFKVAADNGILRHESDINEEFYGFYLAPIFNSVKRMSMDISLAFGVFFGENPADDAEKLIAINNERKQLVSNYISNMKQMKQPYAPYAYLTDAPSGILGLIANKLLVEIGTPVMVLRKEGNKFTGSGRSPDWYPCLSRLLEEKFYGAGHDSAFAVGFDSVRELKSAIAFLSDDVSKYKEEIPAEELNYDFVIADDSTGDVDLDIDMFREYLSELEYYRPFGKGFPAPFIKLKFNADTAFCEVMGSEKQHLKIRLPYGFDVLCWNQASRADNIDGIVCVEGHLEKNEFNNSVRVQFVGDLV